jgi:hypothetical protein
LLELADGGAAIGREFSADADAFAHATLAEVELALRAQAEAFARPVG